MQTVIISVHSGNAFIEHAPPDVGVIIIDFDISDLDVPFFIQEVAESDAPEDVKQALLGELNGRLPPACDSDADYLTTMWRNPN